MPASTVADPRRPVARPRLPRSAVGGFTLIELMIAVAIVAILAAVALPSYQSYVRKGNRADGTSLLQAVQLGQEKYRLGHSSYASNFADLKELCRCESTSERKHYTLAIKDVSATTYTLVAEAATTMQKGDTGCTAITLTVGDPNKKFGGRSPVYDPPACWSK